MGCIDGTHIKIQRPARTPFSYQYICRKGYYSINVMAMCDADYKFTHLNVSWPGSAHDSYILRQSKLWAEFESKPTVGIVLGDSAYPCRYWLQTPYSDPSTPSQLAFNATHCTTRVRIEHTFGQFKRRFALMGKLSARDITNVATDITACAILHNIAKMFQESDKFDVIRDIQPAQGNYCGNLNNGVHRRNEIAALLCM